MDYDGEWVHIGGNIDDASGTISVRTGKLGNVRAMAGDVGEIESDFLIPQKFVLNQNYPNPFNPSTTISMELPFTGQVSLVIYDVLGREVIKLVDAPMSYGVHRVSWDGRNATGSPIASGVYFARMESSGFSAIKKMVLVK
jgi:FlgD Ig-like domain